MRISVWSCRWRAGPCRTPSNRASRRRASARSIVSDAGRDRGPDRPLGPVAAPILDQLLELHHAEDEALGPRRAARHVDVDGHDPVDALDRRIRALVAATRARAVAHGDAP